MTLTVGSLFSGIGGLELGLERAGMKVLWQVESDAYAQKVLRKHWPEALLFDDVRTLKGHHAPPVDVLCGGFPCQDISLAGKGAGLDGERSGLWKEYLRLIRELRPRYVLVENVAALLVRGIERVLGDLAASGFDAEWDCIPAASVGAPHRRDRLFVVAYSGREPRRLQSKSKPRRSRAAQSRVDGELREMANASSFRWSQGREVFECGGDGECDGACWATEPDVGRVAHGIPKRVDRLRCLGNAVVPQVAEFIGRRIVAHAEAA